MKVIYSAMAAIVGIALSHSMMSFYYLSFDPHNWTEFGRYIALNLYLIFGGVLSGFTWMESK